jgi:hypothetical protein
MTKIRSVLIGMNVLLAALVCLCLWIPLPPLPIQEARQVTVASSSTLPSREVAMPNLPRPLFHSGSDVSDAPSSREGTSAPGIRLVGVLLSDDARIAFIERSEMPLERVGEGERIDGWTVTSIEPRQLTLTGQGQVMIYELDPHSEGE